MVHGSQVVTNSECLTIEPFGIRTISQGAR